MHNNFESSTCDPLEYKIDNLILTLSACMGRSTRMKRVYPYAPNGKSLLFENKYQFPILWMSSIFC